jgi:hypothetical protein
VLSSPKKHFIQGHDGKAKVIVRKIMRSPEFRRVAEMWREICGVTLGRAAGN